MVTCDGMGSLVQVAPPFVVEIIGALADFSVVLKLFPLTAKHVEVDGQATEPNESTGAGAVSLVQVLPPSVVETMLAPTTPVQSDVDGHEMAP
ncbi:MAG: hypothetical protein M1121_05885, partial [Actinobacteria bacterium]|nr:hypothetical protein [Actinomycetota bacterium]